jgi:cytochrome c oxidase cbb3-type subunit 3
VTIASLVAHFFTGSLLAFQLAIGQTPEPQPPATPADLAEGQHLFATQCAYCHGPKGEGGQGAVLALPRLSHAPDDQALFRVIRGGIPGTRMPASAVTAPQAWQLVAYVRNLGRVEGARSQGDASRGQQIYAGKGACSRCHTIGGHGGAIGPDLSDIGARQNAAYMRTSILDPDASVPFGFLQVHVVLKEDRSITGIRINEDTFSIQIRDLSNQVQSFWKTDLVTLEKEPKRSLMPGYRGILNAEEVENLVAYLQSLTGGQ